MDKSDEKLEEDVSKDSLSEEYVVVSDDKQYVCNIYQEAFTLESSMITHRDTIHNYEKNYACDKYKKKF
uniref:C2H2-type domain-containing protein n=1 Tax=Trichogramma kaykai TaxID=54128 RepID=A0ABD2X5N0_9HYME